MKCKNSVVHALYINKYTRFLYKYLNNRKIILYTLYLRIDFSPHVKFVHLYHHGSDLVVEIK